MPRTNFSILQLYEILSIHYSYPVSGLPDNFMLNHEELKSYPVLHNISSLQHHMRSECQPGITGRNVEVPFRHGSACFRRAPG